MVDFLVSKWRETLNDAEEDIKSAEECIGRKNFEWAIHRTKLGAQKVLCALIQYNGGIVREKMCTKLLEKMQDKYTVPIEIQNAAEEIDQKIFMCTERIARRSLLQAKRILRWAKKVGGEMF